jgi:hypothetical protein
MVASMLARVNALSVAGRSTASFLTMLLAAGPATVFLRRRRARIFIVALAAGEFGIAGESVGLLTGKVIRSATRDGLKRKRRREQQRGEKKK